MSAHPARPGCDGRRRVLCRPAGALRSTSCHGAPVFYGAVSRDGACLHLRHVGAPNFAELAAREPFLILATIRGR
ncbi:hypothetical protein ACRAWD_13100 [Caulobacter segnis]